MNFHSVCHAQPFCKPAADAGRRGKKGIATFRQPAEMKGQAPVIKSPWAAIDFFLASITLTVRHDGHGLSTECMNIDEARTQIYRPTVVYSLNINNFERSINDTKYHFQMLSKKAHSRCILSVFQYQYANHVSISDLVGSLATFFILVSVSNYLDNVLAEGISGEHNFAFVTIFFPSPT